MTICVYLHLFSCCWPPNQQIPAKFRENLKL